MAKKNPKIKRYKQYGGGSSFHAKPRPITVVLSVLGIAALIYVGTLIYKPFYNFIMSDHSAGEVVLSEPEPDADAEQTPQPEPEPEVQPALAGELRAAFLPFATAQDAAALDAFLAELAGSDLNAVMLDIKDASGTVLFDSGNAMAAEWGTLSQSPINLKALAETLDAKGFSLVARISCFRDPRAASAGRDNAIRYMNTDWLWLDAAADAGGQPWLNPYAQGARDYITALALEAADAGAAMILLDNVQFPLGSSSNANFGAEASGTSRTEILDRFVSDLTAQLEEKGARTGVYLTAISLAQSAENETRFGGSPIHMAGDTVVLGAMPSQFGGSYNNAGLVLESPAQNPGETVRLILDFTASVYADASLPLPEIIPLLQGVEPGAGAYTKAQIDEQIGAADTAGFSQYVLYSTSGSYARKEP